MVHFCAGQMPLCFSPKPSSFERSGGVSAEIAGRFPGDGFTAVDVSEAPLRLRQAEIGHSRIEVWQAHCLSIAHMRVDGGHDVRSFEIRAWQGRQVAQLRQRSASVFVSKARYSIGLGGMVKANRVTIQRITRPPTRWRTARPHRCWRRAPFQLPGTNGL